MLRGPGDEIVTQKHHVAPSGPVSVGTTSPVNISVDDEVRCRGVAKKQAEVEGALEVPKCWNGLRGLHPLPYHLGFMVGLVSGVPPSWYQS
jgi:hypothetical protein